VAQTTNPWVDAARGGNPQQGVDPAVDLRSALQATCPLKRHDGPTPLVGLPTGPAAPQQGVGRPARRLPSRPATPPAALWVVGTHGGAGESSIAELDDSWAAARHAWPRPVELADRCICVLTARTNVRGLTAAQAALIQWASDLEAGTTLLGLVLIADAPGRLPRPLRDLAAHVRGGAPRTWELPWLEDWRLGEPDRLQSHRAVRRLVHDLQALTSATAAAENPRLASNETAATVDAVQTKGQEV